MNGSPAAARREPITGGGLIASSATLWGHVRHELLFLSYALMEIALLTPVILVILGWARYWPAFQVALWLLLVMLLPLNLIRLMGLLRFDVGRQRRILNGGLLVTILLSWRILLYDAGSLLDLGWLRQFAASFGEGGNLLWTRDLSVFIVTAFMWWRGIRLAVRHPEINNVGLRLRLGGLILMPLVIWFGSSFLEESVVGFVLLFFLAALTAVSLVRAENIEQERSGTSATLSFRWFLAVFGAALAVALAGGLIGTFISGDSIFAVMAALSPMWRALEFGATVAGHVLLKVANPALDLFGQLVEFLSVVLASMMNLVSEGLAQSGLLQEPEEPMLIPTPTPDGGGAIVDGRAITGFIMLALVGLIALGLARAFRQATLAARESAPSRSIEERREEPGLGRRVLERLGLLRQWRAAASVRRIYRLMSRAAAAAGFPRLDAETPYEYLPALAKVWPDHAADTRLITEAYVRVRYGEAPETAEELEALRAAWRRLESAKPNRRADTAAGEPVLEKRE